VLQRLANVSSYQGLVERLPDHAEFRRRVGHTQQESREIWVANRWWRHGEWCPWGIILGQGVPIPVGS
jgi:hypothetical protein